MTGRTVTVIGAGLAGSEAAYQVVKRGIPVRLVEMRPARSTEAHTSAFFGELVCSNSLGSNGTSTGSGLLKQELRQLGSMIIDIADNTSVPAGGALAVDRWQFARTITERLESERLLDSVTAHVTEIPDDAGGPVVIATGPLTSTPLARSIRQFTGQDALYFYDAASPIVATDSIDMTRAFRASRYDKDETPSGDYINCPMTEDEYSRFYEALLGAESAMKHAFEQDSHFFEGCLPVEEIARRGRDTLRYGPMKPVGLLDPATGGRPHAVVQLRQDDKHGRMYNIVGFQTSLRWGEQDRVFRMIPALRNAEFLRYGVMHRNTYIHSPGLLRPTMQTRKRPELLFAGQIVGVEGYVESVAMGLIAGVSAALLATGVEPIRFPETTMIGALARYVSTENDRFQPMNSNWGLLPPVPTVAVRGRRSSKKLRNEALVERALSDVQSIL